MKRLFFPILASTLFLAPPSTANDETGFEQSASRNMFKPVPSARIGYASIGRLEDKKVSVFGSSNAENVYIAPYVGYFTEDILKMHEICQKPDVSEVRFQIRLETQSDDLDADIKNLPTDKVMNKTPRMIDAYQIILHTVDGTHLLRIPRERRNSFAGDEVIRNGELTSGEIVSCNTVESLISDDGQVITGDLYAQAVVASDDAETEIQSVSLVSELERYLKIEINKDEEQEGGFSVDTEQTTRSRQDSGRRFGLRIKSAKQNLTIKNRSLATDTRARYIDAETMRNLVLASRQSVRYQRYCIRHEGDSSICNSRDFLDNVLARLSVPELGLMRKIPILETDPGEGELIDEYALFNDHGAAKGTYTNKIKAEAESNSATGLGCGRRSDESARAAAKSKPEASAAAQLAEKANEQGSSPGKREADEARAEKKDTGGCGWSDKQEISGGNDVTLSYNRANGEFVPISVDAFLVSENNITQFSTVIDETTISTGNVFFGTIGIQTIAMDGPAVREYTSVRDQISSLKAVIREATRPKHAQCSSHRSAITFNKSCTDRNNWIKPVACPQGKFMTSFDIVSREIKGGWSCEFVTKCCATD